MKEIIFEIPLGNSESVNEAVDGHLTMAAREKKPTELVKGIQDRPKAVQGPKNVKNLAAVKHSKLGTLSTVLDDEVIKDVVPLDHPVPYKQEKEVSYPSATRPRRLVLASTGSCSIWLIFLQPAAMN